MMNHNKGNNTYYTKGKDVEDSNNHKYETDKCGSRNEKKNTKKKYEKNRNIETNKYNGFRKKEEGVSIFKNGDEHNNCNSNNHDSGNNMGGNIGVPKIEYNQRNGTKESKSFYDEKTKTYKSGNVKAEERKRDLNKEIHANEERKNKNCTNGEYSVEEKTVEKNKTAIKSYEPQVSNDSISKEQHESNEKVNEKEKDAGKDMGKNKEKEKIQKHKLQIKKSKNIANFNSMTMCAEQTDIHTDTFAELELKSNRVGENTKKEDESSYSSLLREKENEINTYLTETCVDVGRNNILKMDYFNEKSNTLLKNDSSVLSEFSSSYISQKRKGGIQEENEERDGKHRKNVKNAKNAKNEKQDEKRDENKDEKKALEKIQRNVKKEKNVIKKASANSSSYEKTEGVHICKSNISNTNSNNVPGNNTTTAYANKETSCYVENKHHRPIINQNCVSYSTNQYSTDNEDKGADATLIGKYASEDVSKDTVVTVQKKEEPLPNQKSKTKGKTQTFDFEKTAIIEKYGNGGSKEKKVPGDLKYNNDAEGKKMENTNNEVIDKVKTKPSVEELLLEKKKLLEQEAKEKKKQKTCTAEIIRCELIWGPTKNKEPITPVENCELHPVVIIKDQFGHLYDDDEDNENNPIGKTANIYYRWSRGPPRTVCFFHPQKMSCLQCTATSRCFCSYECFIKGFVQLHKYYKSNDAYVLPSHPNIHTYGVPCSPFDWENYENNMEFDEQHYNSLIQAGLLSKPDEEIWETVHNERNYVPCASDIGHQLRLETLLLDKDGEFAEEMVETYVSSEEESEDEIEMERTEEKLKATEETEKKMQQKVDRAIEGETQNEYANNGTEEKEVSHGERHSKKESGRKETKQKNGANHEMTKTNVGDHIDDDGISDKENLIKSVGYGDVYKLFQNSSNTTTYLNQFAYNTNPSMMNCIPVYNDSNMQASGNPYIKNEHIISDGTSVNGSLVGTWKDMNCNMGVDYATECGVNYNMYETNYNRTYNMNFGNTDGGNFISNTLTTNWNKASFPNSNEEFYQANEMGAYAPIAQQYGYRGMNEMENNNTREDVPIDVDAAMNNNHYIPSSYANREDNGNMYVHMNNMESNNFPYVNNTEQECKRDVYYNLYDKKATTALFNTSFSNGEMQHMNTTFLENSKKQGKEIAEEKNTVELVAKQQRHSKQKKKKKKKVYVLNDAIWNMVDDPRIYHKIITGCCIPNVTVFPNYNITCFKNSNLSNPHNQFTIMTWNVLAEIYGTVEAFPHCDPYMLAWSYRKTKIMQEILSSSPDIVCLQEIQNEHFLDFFKPSLREFGYEGVYKQKTKEIFTSPSGKRRGGKYTIDGCAIFYNTKKLKFVETYALEFSKLIKEASVVTLPKEIQKNPSVVKRLLKDNVALVLLLEFIQQYSKMYDHNEDRQKKKLLIVANTHIVANPEANYVKIWQAQVLVKVIEYLKINFIKKYETIPSLIICGDFNSTPNSAVYQLIYKKTCDRNHEDFNSDKYSLLTELQLGHNLNLKSAYAISKLLSQKLNPDHCQNLELFEPLFTNYTGNFIGCLDYIFYNDENLNIISTVNVADEHQLMQEAQLYQLSNCALPSPIRPSDHLPLIAKFEFKIC